MLNPIGEWFIFVATLALFAAAHSKSHPQRRDHEAPSPQANVSQDLFGRALAWQANLKRSPAQKPLEDHVHEEPKVITLPLKMKRDLLVASLEIGTPHHQIVDFCVDTLFSYIWVSSLAYNPTLSSSSHPTLKTFSFTYWGVAGNIYLDTWRIAHTEFENVEFAYATTHYRSVHVDGVLGLSHADLSGKSPSFISLMTSRERLDLFAICHSKEHFKLHLGSINSHFVVNSKIEYHKLNHDGFGHTIPWSIGGGEISIGGDVWKGGGFQTIFDSSAHFIAGDPDVVNSIYRKIYPAHQDGHTLFPCDHAPVLRFRWNKREVWTVLSDDFKLYGIGEVYGIQMCAGALLPKSARDIGPAWIFGNIFMRNRCTIFNHVEGVGFAHNLVL